MKIPFLSAKNKKMFGTGLMWFGLVVLIAVIYRAFKSGAQGAKEIALTAWDEIKEVISFTDDKAASIAIFLCSLFALYFGLTVEAGVSFAVALGTLTTGAAVVSTFNTTYVPKTFFYVAATQLTGVKITVQGDGVIFDSDANGLTHCGVNRLTGQVTNGYYFRISNGFIPGKNVIWEFTNSAAQTPVVYVDSDETPAQGAQLYLQLLRQAILAGSGQNFKDFATLSLPSLSATDVVNELYQDGTQTQMNRQDILARLQLTQNIVNTPIYMIDNFAQTVKEVNVIAGIAQTAYMQRWVPVVSGGMINMQVNQAA